MKTSESKIIKGINIIATISLCLYILTLFMLMVNSGIPNVSKGIKSYQVYNIRADRMHSKEEKHGDGLSAWFQNKVFVSESSQSSISVRFQSWNTILSLPAISFQIGYLSYFLAIGYLLLSFKRFFKSLAHDSVFTAKNTSLIITSSIVLMLLPLLRWVTQALLLHCITELKLNDSGYFLSNGANFFGTETLIGLVLLAFGFAFKVGVEIMEENEAFV